MCQWHMVYFLVNHRVVQAETDGLEVEQKEEVDHGHRAGDVGVKLQRLEVALLIGQPPAMPDLQRQFGMTLVQVSLMVSAFQMAGLSLGIVGGMLAATCIAIFFVPSFFSMIMKLTSKEEGPPEKFDKTTPEEDKAEISPTAEGGVI